jgi:hypothetical protein
MGPKNKRGELKKTLVRLSLFLLVTQVYYQSPVHYIEDSAYSLLMDEAILHQGTPNMIVYQVPHGTSLGFLNGYPGNIALVKGRLIYLFPWGSPILALPGVAIANALGYVVAPRHVYSDANETQMQEVFTTLLSGLIVCLVYEAAAALLPVSWSLVIALSVAFGTQMWSSVSRSLWPQTWYLCLIMVIILLLLRGWLRPAVLATLLAWSGFVRPIAAPALLILGVFILIELKSHWARTIYLATGLLWAGLLGTMMLFFVGHLLAPVYGLQLGIVITGFGARLAGVLFSPSRGLLIYVPIGRTGTSRDILNDRHSGLLAYLVGWLVIWPARSRRNHPLAHPAYNFGDQGVPGRLSNDNESARHHDRRGDLAPDSQCHDECTRRAFAHGERLECDAKH